MSNAISPYKQFFRTAEYALIVFGLIVLIGPKVFSTNRIKQEAKVAMDKVSALQDAETHPQSLVKKRQGDKRAASNKKSGDDAPAITGTAGAVTLETKQSNSVAGTQRSQSKRSNDEHQQLKNSNTGHRKGVWTGLLLGNNQHQRTQ